MGIHAQLFGKGAGRPLAVAGENADFANAGQRAQGRDGSRRLRAQRGLQLDSSGQRPAPRYQEQAMPQLLALLQNRVETLRQGNALRPHEAGAADGHGLAPEPRPHTITKAVFALLGHAHR